MDGTDLRQIRVVREVADVRKQQQTEDTVSSSHTNDVTDSSAIILHSEFCDVLFVSSSRSKTSVKLLLKL